MILKIMVMSMLLNGHIQPQYTTIEFSSVEDCQQAKLEMTNSLDKQMNKTILNYSLECVQ